MARRSLDMEFGRGGEGMKISKTDQKNLADYEMFRKARYATGIQSSAWNVLSRRTKFAISNLSDICNYCCSRRVWIRGRYPGQPQRQVCPTCLQEKEDDRVISRASNDATK